MLKNVAFDLYVHIGGDPNELLDAIFPDGWEGEIWDVFTDPAFMPKGYVEVTNEDEDEE